MMRASVPDADGLFSRPAPRGFAVTMTARRPCTRARVRACVLRIPAPRPSAVPLITYTRPTPTGLTTQLTPIAAP